MSLYVESREQLIDLYLAIRPDLCTNGDVLADLFTTRADDDSVVAVFELREVEYIEIITLDTAEGIKYFTAFADGDGGILDERIDDYDIELQAVGC